MKVLFNILGILLGFFAAILLSAALFLAPFVSASTKLLQPETIHQTLNDMNLEEELQKIIEQNAPSQLSGIDTALVGDLINSELMEELLEIYIENLLGILEDDDVTLLGQEHITPLLEKHLPEMKVLLRAHLPAEISLTEDQIAEHALSTLEPILMTITSNLPTLKDMGLGDGAIFCIQKAYDKTLLKYTLLAITILSAIILFLRHPRFKGFMWLTVIYGFSALLFFCINKYLLMDDIKHVEDMFMPILEFVAEEYLSSAIIGFVGAVTFLVIFIVGRKVFKPAKMSAPTPL